MTSNELGTQECLGQLREIFPKGHLRAESSATMVDSNDEPEIDSGSYARVTISRATPTSAKSFIGLTLSDCVSQARRWKESQL